MAGLCLDNYSGGAGMSHRRRVQRAHDTFTLLKANAGIVALLAALTCVVLIAVVDGWQGPPKAVVTNVLGALLSVALVSLVADVYFKTRFAQGFAELVELRDDTRRTGLQRIELRGQADWGWVLEDAKKISVILVDVQSWASSNWRYLQGQAESRAVAIGISFAAPDSPACAELEGRLGRSITATTKDGEAFLRSRWLERQKNGSLDPKATMGTFQLPHAPAYTAALVERVDGHRRGLIELAGSASMPLGTDSVLLTFDDSMASSGQAIAGWLLEQTSNIEQEESRTWAGQGKAELADAAGGAIRAPEPSSTDGDNAARANESPPRQDAGGGEHDA
jgi:hypothetical protein